MKILALVMAMVQAGSGFGVLTAYNGSWSVMAVHPFSGKAGIADRLENKCTASVEAYTCEQTVNGVHAATVIFTSVASQPQTYTVTNVLPSGEKFSNTQLRVNGDEWTYRSTPGADAKATMYKTVNVFHGADHIHFVQSQSTDGGATWMETNSGDEARL